MFVRKLALACSISGYAICSFLAACTYEAPIAGSGGAGGGAGMGGSGGESAPWWNPAWKKRVRITFQNAPGEHLDDFPVMIRLNPERIGETIASTTGPDLRFLDDDGKTILDHEVELWSPGGDAYVWVRIPRIDATNTDHIWLYYDNSDAADEAKPKEVWVDFLGVYHLTPSMLAPNNFPDSTETLGGAWSDYDASDMAKPPTVPGIISRAANLDGIRHIHLGDNNHVSADVDEARTVEAWVQASVIQEQMIVYEEGGCLGWYLGMTATGAFSGSFITDEAEDTCAGKIEYSVEHSATQPMQWYYLALVIDRSAETMSLYINGASVTSAAIDNTYRGDGNGLFRIGSDFNGGPGTFHGAIDEVRVSSIARSPAWIAAQHKSMRDNFVVFTTE